MNIIVNQIAILIILAIIGYVIQKTGYLPENTGKYISEIVIKVTAPALIVTSFSAHEFTLKTVKDGLLIAFYAFVFMILSLFAGYVLSKVFKVEGASAGIFRVHCMLGNVGYLGLPLLNSILGQKGLVYANFFATTMELLVWTVGVFVINSHKENNWKNNLKNLFNPSLVAFTAGLILSVINIQHLANTYAAVGAVYKVFYNTLSPLGGITLYIVMIFIGMSLAETGSGLKELFKKRNTLIVSFYKLLLMPGIAYVFFMLAGTAVDSFVKAVVILELAMPCAAIVSVLAARYESDYKLATDNVVYSTLFSMLTLPVVLYIMNTHLLS